MIFLPTAAVDTTTPNGATGALLKSSVLSAIGSSITPKPVAPDDGNDFSNTRSGLAVGWY